MPSRPPFPTALDPLQNSDPNRVGPYRIVGRLSAGGMGAVYGAVDSTGRCLAVKLVHREFADNDEFRARFAREVRLVQQVDARCTPAFAGADPDADTPWLATEYVPGPTLREHVTASGPMPEGMVRALAAGLAEALHAIHGAGIVHRDLKPSNVILAPDGPKVLDFGIARALDGTGITRTGGLMGSPGWIAPERYHGAEASPAADIFAWGGLVAFAATGQAPFGSGTPQVVVARTLNEAPNTQAVPKSVRFLVNGTLAPTPETRPSLGSILASLGASAPSTPPQAPPATIAATLIDAEWRDIPDGNHDQTEWVAQAAKRRIPTPVITAVAATTALVLASVTTAFLLLPPDQLASPEYSEHTATSATPPASATLPANVAGHGEFTAENPGIFRQSINNTPVVEVSMDSATPSGFQVNFTGTARYIADSGSLEFGTGYFYLPADNEDDPSGLPGLISEPGEIFGVLSADSPELEFAFSIMAGETASSGTLFFNTDDEETDPHLCYRSEPYAETGTQFLHNEGDSWRDCALDPYE